MRVRTHSHFLVISFFLLCSPSLLSFILPSPPRVSLPFSPLLVSSLLFLSQKQNKNKPVKCKGSTTKPRPHSRHPLLLKLCFHTACVLSLSAECRHGCSHYWHRTQCPGSFLPGFEKSIRSEKAPWWSGLWGCPAQR